MEGEFTSIWERLPSESGTHFEGAKEIRLESWDNIKETTNKIISYCVNVAKDPTFIMVLGTWGQGKTEFFKKYLIPKLSTEHHLIFLSANYLINILNNQNFINFLERTNIDGLKILTAIFRIDQERKDEKNFLMDIDEKKLTPLNYINEILENFTEKASNQKRIFIFVDEMEELQSNKEILLKVLKGFKDIKNAGITNICENGLYEGRIHFFLSCTPEAYNKMEQLSELKESIGSIKRRYWEITLPTILKMEACKYLWDLINYCWKYKLPNPLPIKSGAILNALHYCSLGNLGNIVSNFTRLFTKQKKNSMCKVIDYQIFINSMKNEIIQIGNVSESALKYDQYQLMYNKIKENATIRNATEIFSLMIGEPIPLSINDIKKRLNVEEDDIRNAFKDIELILQDLLQISYPIINLFPISSHITKTTYIEEIKKIFSGGIKIEDENLRINDYMENLNEFINRSAFPIIENRELLFKFFLPKEKTFIKLFFEGISELSATKFKNDFEKYFFSENEEEYYILSNEIIHLIYPVPLPPDLDFLTDVYKIYQLYQEVKLKQRDYLNENMLDAFIFLFKSIEKFQILKKSEQLKYENCQVVEFNYKEETGKTLKVKVLIAFINGNFDISHVKELIEIIQEDNLQLVLPIYTGFITDEAKEMLSSAELDENHEFIVPTNLRITLDLAIKVVTAYLSFQRYPDKVKEDHLALSCKKFIEEIGLNLDFFIGNWLEKKIKNGSCIIDLKGNQEFSEYPKFLKLFYMLRYDYVEIEELIEEFKNPEKVKGFGKSRSGSIKTIQIPDEVNKLNAWAFDLVQSGFLEELETDEKKKKYKIKESLIEQRILKMVKEQTTPITTKKLDDLFIIYSSYGNLLNDVYLPILEDKGIIEISKNSEIKIINYHEKWEKLKIDIQNFEKKFLDPFGYGWFFEIKQRDKVIISLNEFKNKLINEFSKLSEYVNENEWIYNHKLIYWKQMLELYNIKFIPPFNNANEYAISKLNAIVQEKNDLLTKLKIFEKVLKYLHINLGIKNIKDYADLNKEVSEIQDFHKIPLQLRDLSNLAEEIFKNKSLSKQFLFKQKLDDYSNKDDFPFWNLKLWQLSEKIDSLSDKISRITKECDAIEKKLFDIENIYRENNAAYTGINQDILQNKSKLLFDKLKIFVEQEIDFKSASVKTSEYKLQDIIQIFNDREMTIKDDLKKIRDILNKYMEFISIENDYVNKSNYIFSTCELIEKNIIFDFDNTENKFKEIYGDFQSDYENYRRIEFDNYTFKDLSKLEEDLVKFNKILKQNIEKLKNFGELEKIYNKYRISDNLDEIKTTANWVTSINWENMDNYKKWLSKFGAIATYFEDHSWENRVPLSDFNKKMIEFSQVTNDFISKELTEKQHLILKYILKSFLETESKPGDWILGSDIEAHCCDELKWNIDEFKKELENLINQKKIEHAFRLKLPKKSKKL